MYTIVAQQMEVKELIDHMPVVMVEEVVVQMLVVVPAV